MSFLKYIIIVFLLASFTIKTEAQQKLITYTLQQCIDSAIKNNLDVKKSGFQMEQDRIYWKQQKENMLPNISGEVDNSIYNGRSLDPTSYSYTNQQQTTANYTLSGSLLLFNGLSLQHSIRQTFLAYQAGRMDYQQAKDLTTLNVITAYLVVLGDEDQLAQAKSQIAVSEQQAERINILNNQGAAKPTDVTDIKGQLAGDKVSVITSRTTLTIDKLNLLQLMNVRYENDFEVERLKADQVPGQYATTADSIYNKAISDLPIVKAATFRRQSAEKEIKAAKGGLFPTLTLSGGLNTNYSSAGTRSIFVDSTSVPTGGFINTPTGKQPVYATVANYASQNIGYMDQLKNNYNTSISLGLHIPIFNFFQQRNKIALAKIDLFNARAVEETTQIQLKQNISQAYVNMTSAYEKYQALREQVDAYTEGFRVAEINYNAGVLTSVDYVTYKNKMDQANINLINARYSYFIRTKILDYYQGKLSL